jgi:carbonic anhydrase/acetyltransferase-like protein (isoleucine patch superfamily)
VTVLDGAHICEGAAIAPGSVVTPRKTVGAGEVWSGIPARKIRTLSKEEQESIKKLCDDLTAVF